ncbi:hypothetical protein MsAg5_03260 [Methanosarcinaceae archaeon Ag5]|uniref:Nop domain-containing protein n=1 Tax=Methanolapillus africanus TaxID=3028297 RepID=A0AAE4MH33_9EURY|nr:hypothetical protein [Methanosarcinaceae archaeon Ag5]
MSDGSVFDISVWFGDLKFKKESDSEPEVDVVFLEKKETDALKDRWLALLDQPRNAGQIQKSVPRLNLAAVAIESGFVNSAAEYHSLLRDVSIAVARSQISASLTDDKKIIQAVETLDDLNETANHLSERLFEWYSYYYPELVFDENFVSTVAETPEKASATKMGAALDSKDSVLLQSFAKDISNLYSQKSALEDYISEKMEAVAPNVSQIAGVVLGARLISMAGGLKNLATMPAGSLQVMGAEKAMMKHLRSRAPSPKHGIIFSHPVLNTAPMRLRGKIARTFASALSLAARTDFYAGKLNPDIEKRMTQKISQIQHNDAHKQKKAQTQKTNGGVSDGKE